MGGRRLSEDNRSRVSHALSIDIGVYSTFIYTYICIPWKMYTVEDVSGG
jgi:hypothetical protein